MSNYTPHNQFKASCTKPGCDFQLHTFTYKVLQTGQKHLMGFCDIHGWIFTPFVPGLDIPITTKKLRSTGKKGRKIMKRNPNQASFA